MIKGLLLAAVFTAGLGSSALAADEPISTIVGVGVGETAAVRSDNDTDSTVRGLLVAGAQVHVLRCRESKGVDWCRVRATDEPAQGFELGWVEGRYLASRQSDQRPAGDQAAITQPDKPETPPTGTLEALAATDTEAVPAPTIVQQEDVDVSVETPLAAVDAKSNSVGQTIGIFLIGAVCLLLGYVFLRLFFLPTMLAFRNKSFPITVLVLNVLFGWSIIGWFFALGLANSGLDKKRAAA